MEKRRKMMLKKKIFQLSKWWKKIKFNKIIQRVNQKVKKIGVISCLEKKAKRSHGKSQGNFKRSLEQTRKTKD